MTTSSDDSRLTTRAAITFTSGGLAIFGVLHRPADDSRLHPAVVMYHGFLAAKHQPPHRIFVRLAEALARIGIASLRIDLPGRGDSEGESIDITPAGDLQAAQDAVDWLLRQPGIDSQRIALLGVSWGGDLATMIAARDDRVGPLVLWSSAPSELNWQPQLELFDGREAQELWGNLVGRQFYDGLREINTLESIRHVRGPVLLVHGTDDEVVSAAQIDAARQVMNDAGVRHEVVSIGGADHIFMRYHWQQAAVTHTLAWLRRVLIDRDS
jgi:uncharacterized protein